MIPTLRIALALSLAAPLAHADVAPLREQPLIAAGNEEGRKIAAVEVSPLGLFVGHYGASVEVVPVPHHGLVLSAYYLRVESYGADVSSTAQPQVPANVYSGVGGELGYRYYFGALGPHGLYLGPSLLLGRYQADIASGGTLGYSNIGGAVDVGYQAILGPALIGLGAGLQYLHASRDLPATRDLFTEVTTRSALRPRAALTLGYVF